MAEQHTDFGRVADDLRRAASSFALLTSSASLFGRSLQAFRSFEQQLVLTNAIAQGTVKQLEQMKTAAREFSLVTTASAQDAGVALQQLAQAGFSAQQSMNAMNGVLLLSQATMTDVSVTADLLSSNIRAFGLATTDAMRVSNVFAATVTGSLATMDKMAYAMRQVAPVAELANLTIEETSASLGLLFNIGLRGEQAGTALRNIIIRLVRPMGEASDVMMKAGIATRTASGEFRNLADIMTDLANSDLTDMEFARIFETEALAGAKAFMKALTTINNEGISQYEALKRAVTGTDRAVELAAKNLDTMDGQLRLLNNAWEDFQRTLGEAVAPMVLEFAHTISDLLAGFRDLDPATQQMTAKIIAYGVGMVSALAAANALFLIMKGPLVASIVKLTTATAAAATANAGLTLSFAGLVSGSIRAVQAIGATTLTMLGLTSSIAPATGATLSLSAALSGIGARSIAAWASLKAALPALALFTAGIATLVAVGGGLYLLWDKLTYSLKEFEADVSGADLDPKVMNDAKELSERIIPSGTAAEVAQTVDDINNAFLLLQNPADRFGYAGRAQGRLLANAADANDYLAYMQEQSEAVFEYMRLAKATEAGIASFEADEGGGLATRIDRFFGNSAGEARQKVSDVFDKLTDEEKALAVQLGAEFDGLIDARAASLESIVEFEKKEAASMAVFLKQLSRGEDILGENYAEIGELIVRKGLLDADELRKAIVEEVAGREGEATVEEVLRAVLQKTTQMEVADIEAMLTMEQQRANHAFMSALIGLEGGLDTQIADMRAKLLDQRVDRATSIADAWAAAEELGNLNLQNKLTALSAKLRNEFAATLTDFGIGGQLSPFSQIGAITSSLTTDIPEDVAEALDPSTLMNKIAALAEEGLSDSSRRRKIEALTAEYKANTARIIEELADGRSISEADASALTIATEQSAALIADLAADGIDIIAENPDLISYLSGKAFSDAIRERITADTSEAEVVQIMAEEREKAARIIESLIENVAAGIEGMDAEKLAKLREAGPKAMELIAMETIMGLREGQAQLDKIEAEMEKRLQAFTGIGADLDIDISGFREGVIKSQLEIAETLDEALTLGAELVDARITTDLAKYGQRQRQRWEKAFDQTRITGKDMDAIMAPILAEYKDTFGDLSVDFLSLTSGQTLLDMLDEEIDENTTPEEAAQIIAKNAKIFREIMQLLVQALADAALLEDTELEVIKTNAERTVQSAQGKILEVLAGGRETLESIREDFKKRAEADRREAERAAKEALSRARALEDAWTDVGKAMIDARRRYYNVARGLSIEDRSQFARDLDLQSIVSEAEQQIRDLNRAFQDLQIEYKDQPEALAGLRSEYEQLISIIEMERDANIAAADTFTEQMRRRSAALELFQRDLTDAAMASGNTFDMVNAGIHLAFAEYQKDLISIVDITKDAVTGVADAFSTLVGDLIFDQENAWENFKKNILNISRQIVEAFTKSFIQQLMSSITGGGGSILGNALQPSKYMEGRPENSEYPSVGNNFLGRLMGGGQPTGGQDPVQSMAAAAEAYDHSSTIVVSSMGRLTASVDNLTAVMGGMPGVGGMGDVEGLTPGAFERPISEGATAGIVEGFADLTKPGGAFEGLVQLDPSDFGLVGTSRHPTSGITGAFVNPNFINVPGSSGSHRPLTLDDVMNLGDLTDAINAPLATGMEGVADTFSDLSRDLTGAVTAIAGVRTNPNMNPLFSMEGASYMAKPFAADNMSALLEENFAVMQSLFGEQITINDAIARVGTSRERNTPGSRHFHGDALDLSIAGFTDTELRDLVDSALEAGFTGFGFGANILHADTGPKRSWNYGSSFGQGDITSAEMQAYVANWKGEVVKLSDITGGLNTAVADMADTMSGASVGVGDFTAALTDSASVQGEVWNFFTGKGLEPHQVAGIMGNIDAESAFNPEVVNSIGASGLFQHLGSRKDLMMQQYGDDWTDVANQLEFAWQELNTTESRVLDALKASTDVREATGAFAGFERAEGFTWSNPEGIALWDRRLGEAQGYLDEFGGGLNTAALDIEDATGQLTTSLSDASRGFDDFTGQLTNIQPTSGQLPGENQYGVLGQDTFGWQQAGGAAGNMFGGGQPQMGGMGDMFGGGQTAGTLGAGGMFGADGGMGQGTQQLAQALMTGATQVQTAMTQFVTQFQAGTTQVVTALQTAAASIQAAGAMSGAGGGLLGAIGGAFASGGYVSGPGTGTSDDILAWLSDGEFVNDAKSTKRFGPVLSAMNEGKSDAEIAKTMARILNGAPAFAEGGPVGSAWSPGVFSSPITGSGSGGDTNITHTRGGDTLNLRVNYIMKGGQQPDKFRRSASQHAKQLAAQLERAKRNI